MADEIAWGKKYKVLKENMFLEFNVLIKQIKEIIFNSMLIQKVKKFEAVSPKIILVVIKKKNKILNCVIEINYL